MTVAVAMIVSTSSTEIVAVRLHPHSGPIASTIASTNAVACTENPIQVSGKDKMQMPSTESKTKPGAFIRISRDMPTGLRSPDSREYTRGCNRKLAFHVLVGESVHPGVDDRSVRIYKRCADGQEHWGLARHTCARAMAVMVPVVMPHAVVSGPPLTSQNASASDTACAIARATSLAATVISTVLASPSHASAWTRRPAPSAHVGLRLLQLQASYKKTIRPHFDAGISTVVRNKS